MQGCILYNVYLLELKMIFDDLTSVKNFKKSEEEEGMIFQENIHLFKYGRVNIQIMNYFQDSTFPPAVSVRDALRSLKRAILSSQGDVITQTDPETREFLLTWLKNNKPEYATNLYNSQVINNPLLVRVFQDGGFSGITSETS